MWRQKLHFERPKDVPFRRRRLRSQDSRSDRFVNPYFERKKPAFWRMLLQKMYPFLFVFLAIAFGFYFFFYSDTFTINAVEVEGNSDVTYDSIRYVVNLSFVERRWIIFRQNNFFVWNKEVTYSRLREKFPFEELDIQKKFPRTIHIRVKEKIPGFVYINGNNYYYTDLFGRISQTVDSLQLKQSFPKVQDENIRSVNQNEQVFSTAIVSALFYLEEELTKRVPLPVRFYVLSAVRCTENKEVEKEVIVSKEEGMANTNVNIFQEVESEEEYAIVKKMESVQEDVPCNYTTIIPDLKVVFESGLAIYFDAQGNIADQLVALQLVLNQSVSDPIQLEYIDVRIPSRVFYR